MTGAICGDGMCPYVLCKDFPKCEHVIIKCSCGKEADQWEREEEPICKSCIEATALGEFRR